MGLALNGKMVKRIFNSCLITYRQSSQAVRKAGGYYQSGSNELTILIEYVNTLRYFITTVASVIELIMGGIGRFIGRIAWLCNR